MGARNDQASLRIHNNNRQVQNVFSKRRIRKVTEVSYPAPNIYAVNEADTNADTYCLGKKLTPIAYINCTTDVYPYSDAYEPLGNVPIVSGVTAYDHPNCNTYILIYHESVYYGKHTKHSLTNHNHIISNGLDFFDNLIRDYELYM